MKKFLAIILALAMILSLAACGAAEQPAETPTDAPVEATEAPTEGAPAASTDPETMLLEGRYSFKYTAEGHGDFAYFFHFYPEAPVLGSVFYAGLSNNKMNFAGTYKLEKIDYNWACYPDRQSALDDDADNPPQGVAPYTITFYDWDGAVLGTCGYDGDNLYNDMGKFKEGDIYAQGSSPYVYAHDLDVEKGPFANTYAGELGVAFLDFVADEDVTSTLQIYHDGTYADLVGAMIEGTWSCEENAEGGINYVLTPDLSSDTGAVVSVSADRKTCTYTPDGGDAIAMTSATAGKEMIASFVATVPTSYGIDADLTVKLMSDNTCSVVASVAGNEQELDKGTYAQDGYTFNFTFDNAGAISTSFADNSVVLQYVLAGTKIGDLDVTMNIVKSEPAVVTSFTGVTPLAQAEGQNADLTLTLYDDNSCTLVASAFGNEMEMDKGTYAQDGYTFNFTFEKAGEISTSFADNSVVLQYVQAGAAVGDIDTTLSIVKSN